MFFQPKTFLIPRGIIPQNLSTFGLAVSEELRDKQTHTYTLTDRQVLLLSDALYMLICIMEYHTNFLFKQVDYMLYEL